MRTCFITIAILILCFTMIGCRNNNSIKDINAEYFTISYGNSFYDAKGKCEQKTIDLLVYGYNNIELVGTTNQEINYDKSICITFINNDKISGQVTIDDKGVCRIEDSLDNYIIDTKSNLYIVAKKVYDDIKEKYAS